MPERAALVGGLLAFAAAIGLGMLAADAPSWLRALLVGVGVLLTALAVVAPEHFVREHGPRIFLWTLGALASRRAAYWHYPLFSPVPDGPTPAVPARHRPLSFDDTVDPLDGHVETRPIDGPPSTESCQQTDCPQRFSGTRYLRARVARSLKGKESASHEVHTGQAGVVRSARSQS